MPNGNDPKPKTPLKLGLTKRELLEAIAGQGAALADEITTERNLHRGYGEGDPLARPLTRLPEPAYIASGAALTAGLTYAAHKLKQSRHKILRAIGDVAQDVQIGLNTGNAIRNSQLPALNTPSVTQPKTPPTPAPPRQHAENLELHPHPVLSAAIVFTNDSPQIALQKLNDHTADMNQSDLADVAGKFGITKTDDPASASAKLHQVIGSNRVAA